MALRRGLLAGRPVALVGIARGHGHGEARAALLQRAPGAAVAVAVLAQVFLGIDVLFVVAAQIDEMAAQLEVFLHAGRVIELHQRQLDLLMAGRGEMRAVFLDEHAINIVGIAAHDVQEAVAAGGLAPGDGGLDQMPRAVQLMRPAVAPAIARLHAGEVAVHIAVLVLIDLDLIDRLLNHALQLGHGLLFDHVGDRFHPLGDVRIPEDVRLVLHALAPVALERLKAPRLHKPIHHGAHRHVAVERLPLLPKSHIDVHVGKGHRLIRFHRIPSLKIIEICAIIELEPPRHTHSIASRSRPRNRKKHRKQEKNQDE